jgi:serine protease Do
LGAILLLKTKGKVRRTMKRLKLKYLLASLVIITFLLVASGCPLLPVVPSTPASPPTAPTATAVVPGWTPPTTSGETQALPSVTDVVALVKPSVVAINTEFTSYDIFNRPFTQEAAGSGWIIDSDGLIVTNTHVVENADKVTVTLADGRTFTAETVRTDSVSDLAIVKVNATNLPAARVGNSDTLLVGDWVVAIGNSLGMGISATAGIVSATGVSLTVSEGQTQDDLIQTDAAINPGNSGGPLVNMAGEVVGITSVKIAQVGVEGMGYAISSNTATPIVEQLVQQGYVVRPFLGVQNLVTVDQTVAAFYSLSVDHGALIRGVLAGGPADQAGLQAGDVIVKFDDQDINDVSDLLSALYSYQIGQEVTITFWRGDSQSTTHLTLAESPPA